MPTQQQIDRFTLAFHQEAVRRLHADPQLVRDALTVLDRWEAQGASPAGQVYRDLWRRLLQGDLDALAARVCVTTDEAATLRSMSPLGFVLDEARRQQLRCETMAA